MKTLNKNKGFTLVEIMIAVFVLAIGLLGMAGLQMASLKNNHSAYLRTQAVQYAYDIADRMRINAVGITNGTGALGLIGSGYDNQAPTQNEDCYFEDFDNDGADDNGVTNCTPAEMAGNDLFELINSGAGSELPAGTSVICLDSTPNDGVPTGVACDGTGNVFAIKVWWADDKSGTLKRFVTTVGF